MSTLAGKDYFTVDEAADYSGVSVSHWRSKIQPQFPPGLFFGKQIYRRRDVEAHFGLDEARIRKADRDRQYRLKNPSKFAARAAARRARQLRATPPWADRTRIAAVYAECRRVSLTTGIVHNVDHIYPLRGKDVCGLHVHENLQIITESANLSKGNR